MSNLEPLIITANALQSLAEAVEQLGRDLPERERAAFERRTAAVRRARVELMVWVEEQRG